MERIPILSATTVEAALRRYVTASTLFESTCVAMLEREDEDPGAKRFMDFADAEFCEAGTALESVLQQVIAERVEQAVRLAGLIGSRVVVCTS